MSIHFIVLEAKGKRLLAIADKRMGKGVSLHGELVHWEHVHDNCLKLQPITDKLYLKGGTISDMSDVFYQQLLTVKDKKPSEILEFASKIDREVKPKFWGAAHNEATIFGNYDDGRLFVWIGKTDGTYELRFGAENTEIDYSGGLYPETSDRALKALARHLRDHGTNSPDDMKQAMVAGVRFAASIDKAISATYDFITLEDETESAPNERLLLTSQTGKRVSITGAENNIRIFNDSEQVLIEADDDSAIEGMYYTENPPVVLPGGAYPKDYLGSQNMGDGSFRYYYSTLGPGVSVGVSPTDADGYSTLGRKEIFTNGKFRAANALGTQQSTLDQTGLVTTGNLYVNGTVELKAGIKFTGIGGTSGDSALRIDATGQLYRA